MKSIIKLTLLLFVLQLWACKDNDKEQEKETESEIKTNMLTAATWGRAEVTHSDGDLSDQYVNFAIGFTRNGSDGFDGNFIISSGGHAFSEIAGKWKFSDDFNQIIFDSGKEIDIELSKELLTLDFTVPPSGGKVTGLSGHFVFKLRHL